MLHHFINPLHQFAGIYWACRIRLAVYGNSIYPATLAIIAVRWYRTFGSRGQRGVAKILWGTGGEPRPAGSAEGTLSEQTREKSKNLSVIMASGM